MTENPEDNFRCLSADQQRYACVRALQSAATTAGAKDPAMVANVIANRQTFLPTPEAANAFVAEYAICNAEQFHVVSNNTLRAAIDLEDARRIARESNVRSQSIEEVAQAIAGSENRLAAISELRHVRPDLFGEDTRALSPTEIGRLSPTEYRRLREQHPERLGLRRR